MMLANMRSQFNVRIGRQIKKRIASDRAFCGTTSDIVTEVALENWFTRYNPDERKKFYRLHERQPFVRARRGKTI